MPGEVPKVLLKSLHGTAGKHPGISKMTQEMQQKITSLQSQHTSKAGFLIVNYAFKIGA